MTPESKGQGLQQPPRLEALVSRIDATSAESPAPDTVPSRFPSLDWFLGGGFRRQDLVVLAGDAAAARRRQAR